MDPADTGLPDPYKVYYNTKKIARRHNIYR